MTSLRRVESNGKPHRQRRHSLGLTVDPGGDVVESWEVERACRDAARRIFDPRLAEWAFRCHGDPHVQADGYMVYDARSGVEDSWHLHATDAESRKWALRDEQYLMLRADDARHEGHAWTLRMPAPADVTDLLDLGLDARTGRDLDWDGTRPREDWQAELLADLAALRLGPDDEDYEPYGAGIDDPEAFAIPADYDLDWRSRELFESHESARVMRRSGSTRMGAEDEARLFGWA